MSKKKPVFRALVAVAAAALASQGAQAAATQNLTVSASIAALCKLTLSNNLLDFAGLDVTSTANVILTDAITASYQCTMSTPVLAGGFTVGGNAGGSYSGAMASATTTDTIPFTISWTPPPAFTGAGLAPSAAKVSVPLTGTILNVDYVNKTPATYKLDVPVVLSY